MVIGKVTGRKHLGNMDVVWRIIQFILKGKGLCELDSHCLAERQVAGFCEHGNGNSGFVKDG
jgi:hypothetical protein